MKELIKEIIKLFNKENRRNRKLVVEQQKRINELEKVLKSEEIRTNTFMNRIKTLERKNINQIKIYKDNLKTSVSNLKGHLSKDKIIDLIDEVK